MDEEDEINEFGGRDKNSTWLSHINMVILTSLGVLSLGKKFSCNRFLFSLSLSLSLSLTSSLVSL